MLSAELNEEDEGQENNEASSEGRGLATERNEAGAEQNRREDGDKV
jgi:hypothetical protein